MTNLEELAQQSSTVLFKCKTVFPFTLFPTTIEVRQNRVDIKYGIFFFTSEQIAVMIDDLVNVVVGTHIVFGSAQFEIVNFEKNPASVSYLWREDAIKLKQVVTGLIEAKNAKVSVNLNEKGQRKIIQKIGSMKEDQVSLV